jgi:hypothetical protein
MFSTSTFSFSTIYSPHILHYRHFPRSTFYSFNVFFADIYLSTFYCQHFAFCHLSLDILLFDIYLSTFCYFTLYISVFLHQNSYNILSSYYNQAIIKSEYIPKWSYDEIITLFILVSMHPKQLAVLLICLVVFTASAPLAQVNNSSNNSK